MHVEGPNYSYLSDDTSCRGLVSIKTKTVLGGLLWWLLLFGADYCVWVGL
jgi:hypothetical protein